MTLLLPNLYFSDIFSVYNLFIVSIAIFWMIIGSIQDIRKREVENWWNFSLLIFILAFRAFMSLELGNYGYFLWGLIGLVGGFILANIFYYSRMFAGGDAKLLMALGTVLPLSLDWQINLGIFLVFTILFLISGSIWGLGFSVMLMLVNFKKFSKDFSRYLKKYLGVIFCFELFVIIFIAIFSASNFYLGLALGILLVLCPFLLIYAKAIEDSCMVKLTKIQDLTIGDWLVNPIKIGNKTIKPNWEGLSERELRFIQTKYKKQVLVKNGIPFVPAFLIAFILMLLAFYLKYI